MIVEQMNNATG
jgi:DNA repair exonuclease SbcCD ATPase subunit